MPPRTKAPPAQIDENDSGSEDDIMAETKPASKPRKANIGTKSTKTQKTTRAVEVEAAPAKTATKRKAPDAKSTSARPALKEKTNVQVGLRGDGMDDVDEQDDLDSGKAKRVKTTAAVSRKAPAQKRPGRPKRAVPETVVVVPELQPEPGDVTESIEVEARQDDVADTAALEQQELKARAQRGLSVQPLQPRLSARPQSIQLLQPRLSARGSSVQPLMPRPSARSASIDARALPARERSGSVLSETAWGRREGEADLRQQFRALSRKYEELNLQYQNLRDVGSKEAESNFETLRRASEQKTLDADRLVASLKKEIAELRKQTATANNHASEMAALQKQVSHLTAKNTALASERDKSQASHEDEKQRLVVAQNEIKSLEAKLVTARQQLSGNAAQEIGNKPHARNTPINSTDEVKELKMKENLYSDLTGLLIRSVKCKDGEDEYDCIQTGRNGTLHFHLTVANDTARVNPQTPSGMTWESAEFAYDPFLDEKRDRALLEILPDFLTVDIFFPRSDAVKFYTKILEAMTMRVVVDE